ncbi:MAG: type II secretion system F family protein [Lachnospiraceae bacterium]|nr:type II secretion system F family protein [Lachnospiraceae bacterium]
MKKSRWYFILAIAIILSVFLLKNLIQSPEPVTEIERNAYEEGERDVVLIAESEYGKEEISFAVSEREFDEELALKTYPEFIQKLKEAVLGDHESFRQIHGNISLPEQLEGYPYEVSYEISPEGIINKDGERVRLLEEDTRISLVVTVFYEEMICTEEWMLTLCADSNASKGNFYQELIDTLQGSESRTRNLDYFVLPSELEGKPIIWKEKKEVDFWVLLPLLAVIILLIILPKSERRNREKKSLEEMKIQFPELVYKLAMYLGAGLGLRMALQRIIRQYEKQGKKLELYEQLRYVILDLQNGKSETESFKNFSDRCRIREARRLSVLFMQNSRYGSKTLIEKLRAEGDLCLKMLQEQIQKENARIGTKLLLPTTLLLLVVMTIVMLPAFSML